MEKIISILKNSRFLVKIVNRSIYIHAMRIPKISYIKLDHTLYLINYSSTNTCIIKLYIHVILFYAHSNAPVEEKPKPPSESEDHHDDSSHHPEKERPSGSSRTSKRATSVRSNESSDSGSRKSPMKPRKRSSNSKTRSSPGPGHHHASHDEAKAKAEEDSAKPPGPIR